MAKIFLFVLLLAAAVFALTPEQAAKLEKFSKPCREETGVTLEEVQRGRSGVLSDNPKLRKHVLCVAKKVGLANEDGEIVTDALRSRVRSAVSSDEEAEKIMKQCVVERSNPEETTFENLKCIFSQAPNFSPVE